VVYPFWALLLLRWDFILTTLLMVGGVMALVYLILLFPGWFLLLVAAISALIVWYIFRWAGTFLIRMIVDYDAANGDGLVIIQRLIPHPTLPEVVQFPLQQAAEGSPEVNTRGLFNTLIQQVKWLSFLRPLTVGDLTLRGPAAPFGITMAGIQDPGGVKTRIQADWKKISAVKNKRKAEADRKEDIDRMTVAVTQGLITAARLGMMELKTPAPSVEFKPDTLLAKAEKEVKQQIAGPSEPTPPTGGESLKWPGVSDLRGAEGGPEKEKEKNGNAEIIPPTESTGPGEEAEPEGDEAAGALSRTPPASR
jgi:hypothetical protein